MQISLLCSDDRHPVNCYLQNWITAHQDAHQIELVRSKSELTGGDLLFLVSCVEIISAVDRSRYRKSLVLHASDLPRGRGWSPHIWQLLEGVDEITLSLLEAEDRVDCGRIWKKLKIHIPKHALWDEINARLFEAEIELIDFAVKEIDNIRPVGQDPATAPTYYRKRAPADSQISPLQSIASQFDKIRVCDPNRFPAFFELYGKKYKMTLEKFDE